ncbi:MAG: N-acetylmuramoyl-L-alanine amidase [Bacteroidales bacterium]|nr:N-acetylmuramoyl-L-alanine amidase [Bacteroidales bacterium]
MKRTIYLLITVLLTCFSAGGQTLKLATVCIDPGHGGKDPGCVSKDGKTYEKTLTLDISKRLAEKINAGYPGVKVVLTRDSDKTLSVGARPAIANKVGADLFISIHINSVPKTTPSGYSVHVLGQSSQKDRDLFAYNMDICKRENSVILLEDDYTTTYQGFDPNDPESFIFLQLMQNSNLEQSLAFAQLVADKMKGGPIPTNRGVSQDPFLVLWKTAMPAVLIEIGFLSNSDDLTALKSPANRDKIATRLFNAFKEYKSRYDGSLSLDVEVEDGGQAPEKPSQDVKDPGTQGGVQNGIQIFAGSKLLDKKDKSFLGYEPRIVKSGKLYKYVIAVEPSVEESKAHLSKVRKKYPDSFLVKIEGETVSIVK